MEYEELIYAKKDGVAVITLDRPEKMNALSAKMSRSLGLALADAKLDDEVRVVVLTGSGRGFCAGADVRNLRSKAEDTASNPTDRRNYAIAGNRSASLALYRLDKPTIAMVNGAAMGGGCDLALLCDMRIASEAARFGEVYIKLGTVPANGGMFLLPRLIGIARACELLFTGDIIDAQEAERIGLVNRVVPHDELEAETMDLARKIAMGPPIALRLSKRGIYDCLNRDLASAFDYTDLVLNLAQRSEDYREGLKAFAEKRYPIFKGR